MKDLGARIRDVQDFPKPGILFKDITTLLKDPRAFRYVLDQLANAYIQSRVEVVVAIGSEGRDVSEADALSLVAGYGIGLDLTYYLTLAGEHAWKAGFQPIPYEKIGDEIGKIAPDTEYILWGDTQAASG